MEKMVSRRKSFRRNYKRLAAAVIGTAIMTGAALPGLPFASKALANERPSPASRTSQTNLLKKTGWHEHKYDWPSPDENQGWYENGRIYYRSDSNRYKDYSHYERNPIEFVKDYARKLGFDRNEDIFTILSQSNHRASVLVLTTSGQRFTVDIERSSDDWNIVAVRSI